jgi:hypothetical protein
MAQVPELRVLYFVEGFTDIRFVVGLSEICDLTMAVPAGPLRGQHPEGPRGCQWRAPAGARDSWGGWAFRRAFAHWKMAGGFDVILNGRCQIPECIRRGALR